MRGDSFGYQVPGPRLLTLGVRLDSLEYCDSTVSRVQQTRCVISSPRTQVWSSQHSQQTAPFSPGPPLATASEAADPASAGDTPFPEDFPEGTFNSTWTPGPCRWLRSVCPPGHQHPRRFIRCESSGNMRHQAVLTCVPSRTPRDTEVYTSGTRPKPDVSQRPPRESPPPMEDNPRYQVR